MVQFDLRLEQSLKVNFSMVDKELEVLSAITSPRSGSESNLIYVGVAELKQI